MNFDFMGFYKKKKSNAVQASVLLFNVYGSDNNHDLKNLTYLMCVIMSESAYVQESAGFFFVFVFWLV